MECFFLLSPEPNDGDSFSRPVFHDAIRGQSVFATNLAAVFEPLAPRTLSPGAQAGVRWLWDKKLEPGSMEVGSPSGLARTLLWPTSSGGT